MEEIKRGIAGGKRLLLSTFI
ncbi:hypothetical protein J005_03528 [Cryptococcus neoformans]|nr:hypothetical protein J005_03528 [Cryptococcus neoformans var. grubii]